MHIQRNKANRGYERSQLSDYDRMEEVSRVRPTVHALRTQLDETDRRLMAIDDHINSTNDELAREIEALREEK
jgi:phage shock protein C